MKNYLKCHICSSKKIKNLHTIYKYPMCGGPVTSLKNAEKIKKNKLSMGFCPNCGSCSLVYPPTKKLSSELYNEFYTSSNLSVALGATVDTRQKNLIKLIIDLKAGQGPRLLEIGCYDGALLYQLKKLGFIVFGCEPSSVAKIGIKKYHIPIENEYFSPKLYNSNFFNVVILRNVLEHIFNPIPFLCSIRKVITLNGYIAIEVPDGFQRISQGILGSIVPEHPSYFWSHALKLLLRSSGFFNIQVRSYKGGLLIAAQKNNVSEKKLPLKLKTLSSPIIKKLEKSYKGGIKKNLERHQNISSLIKNNLTKNKKIILFGANTHSLELLVQGSIKKNWVKCIIDDDPLKWDRGLVGFGVPVKSRGYLKKHRNNDIIVVCSYFSEDIIINSLKKELSKPLRIIRTYPSVKLLSFK